MKYIIDKQEKFAVLSIQEETLNSLVAPKLKSELVILHNEGVHNLVLNLETVKFVDSSGLSAILTANRLWSDGRAFVLTGVNHASVKKLIEISRLDTVLNIIPTVEESIDYIFLNELESELQADSDTEEA